jgi:hypothetical protein
MRPGENTMAELSNQAAGLLDTCKVILESGYTQPPEPSVLALARAVIEEARRRQPNDPVLRQLTAVPETWPGILAAMQVVLRSGIT